jgi:hypothetical protein
VRRAAAAALGDVKDARAAGALVVALGDPGLQATAFESLRRLGATALPEMERAFAAPGGDAEVRRLLVDLAGRAAGRGPRPQEAVATLMASGR